MRKISTLSLLLPELKDFIKNKKFVEAKKLLVQIHSMDLAFGFDRFNRQEKIIVFKLLDKKKSLEIFESLKFDDQEFLINNLTNTEVSEVLNEMAPDERVDFFHELSPRLTKKFFSMMRNEEIDDVKKLISYKEGSAGSLMTTETVLLNPDMTARRALLKLQQEFKAGESENIYSNYVVDAYNKLVGAVDLQDLVMTSPDILVKDIMTSVDVIKVDANSDDHKVADLFTKYDLLSVPVVSDRNQLLGIIVFDDIVDLMQNENTKEIYELGKMHIEEGEEVRYASSTSFDLFKRRAGWMVFLLVFDFLTGTIIKNFEGALSRVVALTFFIPMILDTGGNAGGQVSFSIIRGLATGDVINHNVYSIIKKEFLAAVFMSAIVGIVAFIRAYLLQYNIMVALVVGLTMNLIVFLAVATGIFLPLISKKVGLDPAVLAGPITTSIVDIVGLIIYFSIAVKVLPVLAT